MAHLTLTKQVEACHVMDATLARRTTRQAITASMEDRISTSKQ
jgi:hypothetical protein